MTSRETQEQIQVCERKLVLDNFTEGSKGEERGLTNQKSIHI